MKTLLEKMQNEDWKSNVAAGLLAGTLATATPAMAASPDSSQSYSQSTSNIVAQVIAGEAAGEGYEGMYAVACVIQNRGGNPVSVVTKPKQFSAYDDKALMKRNYAKVKKTADEIASKIGNLKDVTGGADHYVTKTLYAKKKNDKRSWISRMKVTKVIGNHVFMKE